MSRREMTGDWEMTISESQMRKIVLTWLDEVMFGHKSKVISVRQSRTTKNFTIELEELGKPPLDDEGEGRFQLPKMTTEQRDEIVDPVMGIHIDNITTGTRDVWDGFKWIDLTVHEQQRRKRGW